MAVVKRAGGEQNERKEPGERASDAPASSPYDQETDETYRRADESPRLEQREGQNLRGERREQVEAAAVIIEVDP